jgi:biopolymer transport protein ExbD
MKKKINLKILLTIFFIVLISLFVSTHVEAASASINVNSTGEVNKPITITVSGTGVQWNLKLIVDGSVIAQSDELENYEANKSISFSGTYTPTLYPASMPAFL